MTNIMLIALNAGATRNVCVAPCYWWVSPLVIAVASCIAAILSWTAIRVNRESMRKRATLDLIERYESSLFYQDLLAEFSETRLSGSFETLQSPRDDVRKKQRKRVLAFLNHYELIALGIEQGILDDAFYKSYMRSVVLRDWEAAEGLVQHIRRPTEDSGSDGSMAKAFSKFEALVIRWRR